MLHTKYLNDSTRWEHSSIVAMSARTKDEELKLIITDNKSKVAYRRGNFLGKGTFAQCYEYKNTATGKVFAGKVLSKMMLTMKLRHTDRCLREILIHKSISHQNIVAFDSYFEDSRHLYIMMEYAGVEVNEILKRRISLAVIEVRYIMRQMVLACKYLHENRVIHRDLNLGNIFIYDDKVIKVGGFGSATRICYEGEKKMTFGGNPNYMAPEILTMRGYSYEVDVWSLGCCMYALLRGFLPFESSSVQNTYRKIKKCEYYLPSRLDLSARQLIQKLLQSDPDMRPKADALLMDDFFATRFTQPRLLSIQVTIHPPFSHDMPLRDLSKIRRQRPLQERRDNVSATITEKAIAEAEAKVEIASAKAENEFKNQSQVPRHFYLNSLLKMLNSIIQCKPETLFAGIPEDAQDPSAVPPFVWISKWVDCDKYGMGYMLCDGSRGAFFNDATHLVLLQGGTSLQYAEHNKAKQYFTVDKLPSHMSSKMSILNYFSTCMNGHLEKAGEAAKSREGDEMARVPHLKAWFRTKSEIFFYLSNGTMQINFFQDNVKMILCPITRTVFLIDKLHNFTVYTLPLIKKFGCSNSLASRLRYIKSIIKRVRIDF